VEISLLYYRCICLRLLKLKKGQHQTEFATCISALVLQVMAMASNGDFIPCAARDLTNP
jgi:hypothetical protein